jgi:hypothetical protein
MVRVAWHMESPLIMNVSRKMQPTTHRPWLTGIGYAITVALIIAAWSVHELRLVVASEGLGYALGILGLTMMTLLLLYPLRKRARFLKNAGPVRHWFRAHMILGIVGPLLVLLHSNFYLGSINSQVALFCTIVVASSGVLGRYLYAKIHRGLYGQRLTFDALHSEIENTRNGNAALGSVMPLINQELAGLEERVNQAPDSFIYSLVIAIQMTLKLIVFRGRLRKKLKQELDQLSADSSVIQTNRARLQISTFRYLDYRLSVLRRFSQLHVCERLFSYWHVVHYPLFMVLVVAAIVHVLAVHMY